MGSYAYLRVGNLELDWSKNQLSDYHAALFLPRDLATVSNDYVSVETGERVVEEEPAYLSSLRNVLPRLELLGTTLEKVRRDYANTIRAFDEEADLFDDTARVLLTPPVPFEELLAKLGQLDLSSESITKDFEALEVPDYYAALRLLACHERHLDATVVWRFADIVAGGWAEESDASPRLRSQQQFLIVTEGSTDAQVLERGLAMRRARVADFFSFVDMKVNYPFSGTGNLFNFTKGLASIQIQNRVIVLYDNDAEGISKLTASKPLKLPYNIRVMSLPTLSAFDNFETLGPTGTARANLNGSAASIECYLDLSWHETQRPLVRWTSYHEPSDKYQGALVGKERYIRHFLSLRGESNYDFSKIDAVLDAIIVTAVSMASSEDAPTI